MTSGKTVSDFFMASRKTEEDFITSFNHPFLVLVSDTSTIPEDEVDQEYFTTVGETISIEDILAISEGRMLDPEAKVFAVVKRPGINPYAEMITVGRADNCDIVIRSAEISKFHFYLASNPIEPGQYRIGDGGSKNGTKVGTISVAPKQKERIESGDSIFLGTSLVLRFFSPGHFQELVKHAPRIPSLAPPGNRL
jgi:hypothetical protein